MDSCNTRNWSAWENRQPPGPPRLHVTGEVETPSAHKVPRLARAIPQGINPSILILNLTVVETGETAPEVVAFRRVHYQETVEPGKFKQVQINCDGNVIALLEVAIVV